MTDVRQQGQVEQGGPPKPGTPVIVDVFAKDANDSVEFSHDWRFDGGNSKGGGRIDIPAKKTGEPGTPIHFHLHDDTNMLRFVSHADDVIWVDRNGCPQSQAKDSEITNIQPSPNLLRVYDENEVKCELHYNLRFEPDPDKYYYDPEIRNGGTV